MNEEQKPVTLRDRVIKTEANVAHILREVRALGIDLREHMDHEQKSEERQNSRLTVVEEKQKHDRLSIFAIWGLIGTAICS